MLLRASSLLQFGIHVFVLVLTQQYHHFEVVHVDAFTSPFHSYSLSINHYLYQRGHQTIQQRKKGAASSTSVSSTCLFGQNRKFNSNSKNSKNKTKGLPVIPVIGPIPAAPPLTIGCDLLLDPPTPLQWKALQECVVVHRNQLKIDSEGDGNQDSMGMGMNSDEYTATIDAAPLIAIIDDASGISKVSPPFSSFDEGGRYATLAAVVGITNHASKRSNTGENEEEEEDFLEYMEESCPVDDDTSEVMYQNSNNQNDNDLIVPLSSSVRLVGVGRAVLRKYFYRIPTELCANGDDGDEGAVILGYDEEGDDDDDDEVEINFTNGGYEDGTPIVMAQFEPLVDDSSVYTSADPEKIGEKGQRSYRSSPVHAMSELFNIANKVAWAHDDRRKLMNGIKAARARLAINQARKRGEIDYDDGLEDFDGLGALFENNDATSDGDTKVKQEKMTVDEFLATFKGNMQRVDRSELPQNQPTKAELVEASENYGMGYFGAFSTIAELTAVAVKLLEPYYSKEYRQREEHEAEVSSFVVFRALEGYIDDKELALALHSTSSVERLRRGYELMIDHKIQLKKIAEKISDELRECGEECTDLW